MSLPSVPARLAPLAAAVAAALLLPAPARADDAPAPQPPKQPAPAPEVAGAVEPAEGPATRGAEDGSPRPGGQRRGEGPRMRGDGPMSPEMVERVMAVARDVSPELAERLENARQASPEDMGRAMRQGARRLVALAIVKERNPGLYAIRVEELRLQLELQRLGEEFRAATEAGDAARASALEAQIAGKARAQVDLDLKARAQELVALDEQVRVLRDELADEQRRTEERVAERIDAAKTGKPLQERAPFGEAGMPRQRPEGADAPPRPARPRADA